MHLWVQITEAKSKEVEEEGEVTKGSGYRYIDPLTNEVMVEYHVDASEKLLLLGNVTNEFRGNLSVKMPLGHPLISFGRDESIFKQYLISGKTWIGPDGERNIAPKDEGLGVMISAFQSKEFGFGLPVSNEALQQVNERRKNTKYHHHKAAVEVGYKEGYKKPLTSSPFI
jgi:hypothetical protein